MLLCRFKWAIVTKQQKLSEEDRPPINQILEYHTILFLLKAKLQIMVDKFIMNLLYLNQIWYILNLWLRLKLNENK